MGKATIVSEQGKGEYTVQVNYDTQRAEGRILVLQEDNAALVTEIADAQAAVSALESEVTDLRQQIDLLIDSNDLPQVVKLTQEVAKLTKQLAPLRSKRDLLKARKLSNDKTIALTQQSLPTPQNIKAWCADYSLGLSGEVGVAEVEGQLDAPPIILPNEIESNAYSPLRDGAMQPVISSEAAGVYFNRALLPAWQKWLPTFRVGTLTVKNGDFCSVMLDAATGEQDLNINQTSTLTNVPIEYMNSNGMVFTVGDRVLVQFVGQDWSQPKVVGFETNPKPELRVYILNDAFGSSDEQFINEHEPDGGNAVSKYGIYNLNSYSRRLERKDDDFYFYEYRYSPARYGLVKVSSGIRTLIATNCDRLFGVNDTMVVYYEANFSIYSKKLYMRDRITGSLLGSFNVTIPNQSVGEEERPIWVGVNNQYIYWMMTPDTYNEAPYFMCRSDLNGQNHEVVAQWPFYNMPANGGDGSWRGYHLTEDRIYIPYGYTSGFDSSKWFPIMCYVYDLDMNFVKAFGPLPYANGLSGESFEECMAFAANENFAVWVEDTHNAGVYLHVWNRVIVRNEDGSIFSETWVKTQQTPVNLRSTYHGIKGGLAL